MEVSDMHEMCVYLFPITYQASVQVDQILYEWVISTAVHFCLICLVKCDVKPIIMLSIKTVLKVLTYNITSITAPPNRLTGILAIMSVSS
jgi:flavoprotein